MQGSFIQASGAAGSGGQCLGTPVVFLTSPPTPMSSRIGILVSLKLSLSLITVLLKSQDTKSD